MKQKKRLRLRGVIKGRVQGVGMRATIRSIAGDLDLKGWVKNCSDGSVAFEMEGLALKIRDFPEILEQSRPRHIFAFEKEWLPPTNEFQAFEIRYD